MPDLKELEEVIDARRGKTRAVTATQATTTLTSPLAIGLLLMFMPPVAIAVVWHSPHFSHTARIAVTAYGVFALLAMLAAAVVALQG